MRLFKISLLGEKAGICRNIVLELISGFKAVFHERITVFLKLILNAKRQNVKHSSNVKHCMYRI